MKAMRAIIFKELRENAKWLVLLMLAVGVTLAFGAYQSVQRGRSIVGFEFQYATVFSFSVAGLIVGLLQILQDEKSNRAPFILHRPISRPSALVAKTISGLTIYIIAVGVPLWLVIFAVACGSWANQPFDWRMSLPAVSDIIGGILCYFTGILIAARPARWIGSRIMPIGFTFLVLTAAFVLTPSFGYAVLFIGGGLLVMIPAASAAFIARGKYERSMWLVRTTQVICVGAGIGLLIGAAVAIGGGLLGILLYPRTINRWSYSYYALGRDGQPIVVTTEHGMSTVADLNGKLLTAKPVDDASLYESERPKAYLANRTQWNKSLSFGERLDFFRFRAPTMHLDRLTYNLKGTDWYSVGDRRTIEGVDIQTGQPRGSFGPNGFVPAGQPAQPFSQPIILTSGILHGWNKCIVTPTSILEIDFNNHSEKMVFSTTDDDPILSTYGFGTNSKVFGIDAPAGYPSDVAILTKSTIRVLRGTTELLHLPVEHGGDEASEISVTSIADGGFLVWYGDNWIVTTNAAGQVVGRQTLPPLKAPIREDYSGQWIESLQLVAMPPAALMSAEWWRRSGFKPFSALIFPGVFTASSVIAAFWISRRYRFGRGAEVTWTILGLLFGPTAVLTLLAIRNIPVRIRCAQCGKLRPVNQEQCEHCGQLFDQPATEGIEVFEAERGDASYSLA